MPVIKIDLQSERQINEISNDCSLRRYVICGILKCKTSAIEFMPPYEVDRKKDDKCHQQCIDDKNSGSGVDAENQGKRRHKLQKRQDDCNQIDERCRKQFVSVYYFCKIRREKDLVVARINEGQREYPTGCQLQPAILKYALYLFNQ